MSTDQHPSMQANQHAATRYTHKDRANVLFGQLRPGTMFYVTIDGCDILMLCTEPFHIRSSGYEFNCMQVEQGRPRRIESTSTVKPVYRVEVTE